MLAKTKSPKTTAVKISIVHAAREHPHLISASPATVNELVKATDTLFALDYEPLLRAINHVLFVSKMADATAATSAAATIRRSST